MIDAFRLDKFLREHTLRTRTTVDPYAFRETCERQYTEASIEHTHAMVLAHEIQKKFSAKHEGDGHLLHYTTDVLVLTEAELSKFIRDEVSERALYSFNTSF
jgi:hypothetical protein